MRQATQSLMSRIGTLRGQKVLLDSDLAALYGVATKVLVQAVKRNLQRFPADFMFHLTEQELRGSRSQFVTLNEPVGRGHNFKYRPYAFTEQGVAMLSSVLRSERAVQVNVEIMRAFVRLRGLIAHDQALSRRLDELESKYDRQFKVVFDAIRELMNLPQATSKRRIGFVQSE
jgi:chromosome condensin MukBEF ATPase and DNA-binding subunit MukB